MINYSKILENAVNEIAKLPGIGRRTALRLALHLVNAETVEVETLAQALTELKSSLKVCKHCFAISDNDICEICANPKRNANVICVVQDIRDMIAIENTGQFTGVYHVLGGVISPVDGIGPSQLKLQELFHRIETNPVEEVILALPSTAEGDTTNFYIYKHCTGKIPKISLLARGVGVGEELEYINEVTLGRSIITRISFETQYENALR
ncbi:MAG: recombination mediator RecR [Bacteroidetes bacterium]|nr:recombination mediator RecR [Bacteroidota bacterium]MCL1969386.1 recombination mediator RecR [Bacteroidota bacterium]